MAVLQSPELQRMWEERERLIMRVNALENSNEELQRANALLEKEAARQSRDWKKRLLDCRSLKEHAEEYAYEQEQRHSALLARATAEVEAARRERDYWQMRHGLLEEALQERETELQQQAVSYINSSFFLAEMSGYAHLSPPLLKYDYWSARFFVLQLVHQRIIQIERVG
ncbi:uncharacterized protein LOC125178421 [Hyalella azteca]|uniref:Uncharacterized protein LOC125178421 n=1 Tax=Hyalella azteca TaxID=294128 RepID=A0A979FMW8_HYAAZ|nr:uncharacterized protein LOC125178421 [Hyalella azteca]